MKTKLFIVIFSWLIIYKARVLTYSITGKSENRHENESWQERIEMPENTDDLRDRLRKLISEEKCIFPYIEDIKIYWIEEYKYSKNGNLEGIKIRKVVKEEEVEEE